MTACLDGIEQQTLPADEIIVVVQDDPESERYVTERARRQPGLRAVQSGAGRSVAAYNAGLEAAVTPLVAYVDDDAVPARDWLERIVTTFAQDERVAAVGGRDVILGPARPPDTARSSCTAGERRRPVEVGMIQWFGRMTGNHHIGAGPARDVDVLKGVNMSFRRAAVAGHGFDERLRGPGAVVHAELSICLPLRKRGLRVIYDPSIVVMHHPAPRPAGDHRVSATEAAVLNSAYNEALEIFEYLPPRRRAVFIAWSTLVGNTGAPGLVVLLRDLARRSPDAAARFAAAQRGRALAFSTRRRRVPVSSRCA
ncbi:MAG: glycosyltransferase [Conexibacteraceae bacterium]|nr:glycosyltransferase [Conexibacteraceae bacterium]